jgi:hypothetical protein
MRVHLESHGQNPFLNWANNFETALTPVGKGEFLDRQFWARVSRYSKFDGSETDTGFPAPLEFCSLHFKMRV